MRATRVFRLARGLAPVGVMVAACSGEPPPASPTWQIDCVRVLGIPTPSGQTPLAAIPPPAGVRRDVRIGELMDNELASLADWESCMHGGYAYECCSDSQCPLGIDDTPPGPFQLEATPVLADALTTCYTVIEGGRPVTSRDDTMSLFRSSLLANCHVGPYEDCTRESIPGFQGGSSPDCAELNALCDSSD